MTTVNQATRHQLISRIIWFVVFVAVILFISFINGPKIGSVIQGLTPPNLPEATTASERVWLDQNWDPAVSKKYHHISQGTRTLPIPLSWLLALEEPASNAFLSPFTSQGKFVDDSYLLRFGFIKGETNELNPHGLPIGIASTPSQTLPGIKSPTTAVGFNCAACHTAHLTYKDTEYVIEGGPAATDLGQLTQALGAALGQTLISSKLPIVNGRFERFAKNVLKDDAYNDANIVSLAQELEDLIEQLASIPNAVNIVEGYTRLDALNRIGNQVFALDPERYENYVAIDAPVTYPHIWTASWFNWVQYDGSIMQPLIRNTGEAMGVNANIDTNAPKGEKRFSSAIPINNLWWIEQALSGDAPLPKREFTGLLSPKWPDRFPVIDQKKAEHGAALYQQVCQGCHLVPISSEEIWQQKNMAPIKYFVDGVEHESSDSVLNLKLIPQDQIGTDPAQVNVIANRTVNTAGKDDGTALTSTKGMGIDTDICAPAPTLPTFAFDTDESDYKKEQLVNVPISDGSSISFGLALGGVVQQANEAWFEENYIAKQDQAYYTKDRPNCLRASGGYKARPLNGIWATAPFLHNGSIPSLMDLLSPPDQRPDLVQLGNIEFDPENVGIKQSENLKKQKGDKYSKKGFFILDTTVPGNSNRGHEFSNAWDDNKGWDQQKKGVIGPEFTLEERLALIEYLKTL
ncbi:di-heme-cytochrome C peroxidase [Neptunomonas sp.]|uniref:di-heme-cytochrome C peroxidase n=1 Tax=Neptunomonas sp. TaxID=1971898 RepID=UPI0025F82798|nr:di-heme-cytochrome C peroxidase [Neptunomonas sp.]